MNTSRNGHKLNIFCPDTNSSCFWCGKVCWWSLVARQSFSKPEKHNHHHRHQVPSSPFLQNGSSLADCLFFFFLFHLTGAKSTLRDYYKFLEETAERYPSYEPSDDANHLPCPLTVKATTASIAAMGLTRASKQIDLPYQDCCRHTTTATRSSGTLKLRGKPCGSSVPFSVIEAGQLYLDHLHPSMAHRQLIEQRDRVIRKLGPPPLPYSDSIALDRFERFYVRNRRSKSGALSHLFSLFLEINGPRSAKCDGFLTETVIE